MIRELARAKVNLDLLVTGRRADGYHELDSLVAFADIGDELILEPSPELTLELTGPFAAGLGTGEDNLVLRAAQELAAAAGVRLPSARLRLDKRLPVAAGLGGGSADAAAALRGLRRLWGLPLDDGALAEIGLGLGADVPVCLPSRPARMRGVGERIEPAPPAWRSCTFCWSTRGARWQRPPCSGNCPDGYGRRAPPNLRRGRTSNGWRAAATTSSCRRVRCCRSIGEVLTALAAAPGCRLARMSGSGATCFGLFGQPAEAKAAAAAIARAHPGWWVAACTTGHAAQPHAGDPAG